MPVVYRSIGHAARPVSGLAMGRSVGWILSGRFGKAPRASRSPPPAQSSAAVPEVTGYRAYLADVPRWVPRAPRRPRPADRRRLRADRDRNHQGGALEKEYYR